MIFTYLFRVLFIVFFFGFCVFIHEFGHLLAALWQGLTVEKFSIGFGKKLFGFNWRGVEFAVSLLPFGGYVMLPQLDPSDAPKTSAGQELPLASPKSRAITAFAGPFFNLLFGFFLATVMYFVGLWEPGQSTSVVALNVPEYLPATVAQQNADDYEPEVNPEWAAGLRSGDRIVRVNGKTFTRGASEFCEEYLFAGTGSVALTIQRGDEEFEISYVPAPNPNMENLGYPFFGMGGPVTVGEVIADSPAAQSGLLPGDLILAVNGVSVQQCGDVTEAVRASEGQPVALTYSRNDVVSSVSIAPRQGMGESAGVWQIGVVLSDIPAPVIGHPTPWAQFVKVYSMTSRTLGLLFSPITRRVKALYTGEEAEAPRASVQVRHMSGPLGIVSMLWLKLKLEGIRGGMAFIILITFSLAFMNLLPLPILDGGHILQSLIEVVIRRRLPVKFVGILNNIFAVLLIGLMLYITFFDGKRMYQFHRSNAAVETPVAETAEARESMAEMGGDND